MGADSKTPRYFEDIDLGSLSDAVHSFLKDFELPPEILVDLDKSKIQSDMINYYEANNVTTRNNKLSSNIAFFHLVFKVTVSDMLIKKIEDNYKYMKILTINNIHQIESYRKLKSGRNKTHKELNKQLSLLSGYWKQ